MVLDGMMNGNIVILVVRMMQVRVSEENRNVQVFLFVLVEMMVSSGNIMFRVGIVYSVGILLKFIIYVLVFCIIFLVSGLDGLVWLIIDFIIQLLMLQQIYMFVSVKQISVISVVIMEMV